MNYLGTQIRSASYKHRQQAEAGASWLSLVAATTSGIGPIDCVRVRVRAKSGASPAGLLRLVIQLYQVVSSDSRALPDRSVVPFASVQRSVTAEELARGVELDVVHSSVESAGAGEIMVFAWVEPGQPNFEFDAALARPSRGAYRGCVLSGSSGTDRSVAEVMLTAA